MSAVQHGTSGFSKTPRGLLLENFLTHADPSSSELNGPAKVCYVTCDWRCYFLCRRNFVLRRVEFQVLGCLQSASGLSFLLLLLLLRFLGCISLLFFEAFSQSSDAPDSVSWHKSFVRHRSAPFL